MDLLSAAMISEMLKRNRTDRSDPMADPLDGPEWKELSRLLSPFRWLGWQWRRLRNPDETRRGASSAKNEAICRRIAGGLHGRTS